MIESERRQRRTLSARQEPTAAVTETTVARDRRANVATESPAGTSEWVLTIRVTETVLHEKINPAETVAGMITTNVAAVVAEAKQTEPAVATADVQVFAVAAIVSNETPIFTLDFDYWKTKYSVNVVWRGIGVTN